MKFVLKLFVLILAINLNGVELIHTKEDVGSNGPSVAGDDGSYAVGGMDEIRWFDKNGELINSFIETGSLTPIWVSLENLIFISINWPSKKVFIKHLTDEPIEHEVSEWPTSFQIQNNNLSIIDLDRKVWLYSLNPSQLESSVANIIPSSAVVIPSDSSGPVQIILESSEDMVNWNSANPGTYGASTNERFFRIRAVQDTE